MDETDETLLAFGIALRKEREDGKLTIEALSERSRIPAAKLASYEAGKAEVSLLEVCAVAKALGLTTESLFAKAGI